MAFKTITLSVEAYALLKQNQKAGESFSREIMRFFTRKKGIESIVGILSDEEAEGWMKNVRRVRKDSKVREW